MALETGTIRKLAEQLEDAELQAHDVTMIICTPRRRTSQ